MKWWIFILFLSPFFFYNFSQEEELKVYFDEGQYYMPETGNYVEIKLNFAGYTLNYTTEQGETYAEVEITQLFLKNKEIVVADKYLLKGPVIIDSIIEDFYDIQKYSLAPGEYQYELEIKDIHSSKKPLTLAKKVEIQDFSEKLSLSSFIAAESITPNQGEQTSFTKIGYDVIPMFGNYYWTDIDNFLYYFEVYNSDQLFKDSAYVIEQKLKSRDININLEEFTRYYRYIGTPIQPVSKVIDIRTLPTGSYTLEINVLDRNRLTVARTSFDFDRNNSDAANELAFENLILDPHFEESIPKDSSGYYVGSLIPISNPAEVKNIIRLLKERDKEKNFKYLQAFWAKAEPRSPHEAWMRYKAQVQLVERLYATNYQVGFETDRGRVYLQYGAPNNIIEEPSSPSEYPYEIWRYDKINQYSNRRFVFYNPTNLGSNYRLLHSDMIGEIQNYRWQYALNKRNTADINLDDPTGGAPSHFGGNSSLYYNSY